jgi:exodeoxyribonuclease VII large subunit
MRVALRDARHRVALAARALRAGSPHVRAAHGRERLAHLDATLARAIARRLDRERHRLVAASGRLDSLSPLAVLGRGYSLTLSAERRVIRSWREVRAGDGVRVLLSEGSLDCRVDAAREQDDRPAV